MKTNFIGHLCFAASLIVVPGALQPALRAQPPIAPPATVVPPPENVNAGQGNWATMTPQQRMAAQKAMMHRYGTMILVAAGITDAPTQDAVLDFYIDEQQQQTKYRDKFQKFARGLFVDPNAPGADAALTDDEIEKGLSDLQDAALAEKTRRRAALAALDLKIHYTKNPRLHAILIAGGLEGDEASLANNGNTNLASLVTNGGRVNAQAARK